MYKGTLQGLTVCIKKVRFYSNGGDLEKMKMKVWYLSFLFMFPLSKVLADDFP
jgi:hypothetical protein